MAAFIAAKFVEPNAPLPVDDLILQETNPKSKTLTALTPSPRASNDGEDQPGRGAVAFSRLPTHNELEEDLNMLPHDDTTSFNIQSMDRLALFSMMKQQELINTTDSTANTETKKALNRMFFQSEPSGRTESDLNSFDETLFSMSEACQSLTRGARFAIGRMAVLRSVPANGIIFKAGEQQAGVFWVINGALEVESQDGLIRRVIPEGSSLGFFPKPPSFDPSTPRTRQAMNLSPTNIPYWTETCRATCQSDVVLLTLAQWNQILQQDPFCFVDSVSSFIEDLPMFSILSSAQINTISKLSRYQEFEPGQIIFQQGSEGEDVYLIKRGFVRVLRDTRLEDSDRKRLNRTTRENKDLEQDIGQMITPRFPGDKPRVKAPPPFLERIPPSPVSSPGQMYAKSAGKEDHSNNQEPRGPPRGLSATEKLSMRIRQVEVRTIGDIGSLSTKRLGGGLTPRTTEPGLGTTDETGPSMFSLPPLDLSRINKLPNKSLFQFQENQINNSTLYSPRSPRKLDSNPFVLVELANLGSGRVFGDTRSYNLDTLEAQPKPAIHSGSQPVPIRPFSAVADTRVETFEIRKADALNKLGADIEFLWLPDGETTTQPSGADHSPPMAKSRGSMRRGSFILPLAKQTKVDVKIRDELERKMKWESYKKKIIKQVYEDKTCSSPRR
jgi:CRP-like cAMP-binding protein